MAGRMVIVTGVKQVDDALAKLEPKLSNKFTRKALRNSAKKVVAATKEIVEQEAYNEGVLYKSFKVRALKRKRGRVGVSMFVDRDKLIAAYEAAYGHAPNPLTGHKDPHYYLASIEFGYERPNGQKVQAVRPMRRALYGNARSLQQFFVQDVQEMLNELNKQ